jgi:ABC-2 type transport system permease protein
MQAAAKRGSPHQVLQVRIEPITTQLLALFNVSTNYEQFLAATLVPALIHILAMTAAAWSVGRELREQHAGPVAQPLRAKAGMADVTGSLLGKLTLPAVLLWGCGMAALLYLAQLRGWAVAGSTAGLLWAWPRWWP